MQPVVASISLALYTSLVCAFVSPGCALHVPYICLCMQPADAPCISDDDMMPSFTGLRGNQSLLRPAIRSAASRDYRESHPSRSISDPSCWGAWWSDACAEFHAAGVPYRLADSGEKEGMRKGTLPQKGCGLLWMREWSGNPSKIELTPDGLTPIMFTTTCVCQRPVARKASHGLQEI